MTNTVISKLEINDMRVRMYEDTVLLSVYSIEEDTTKFYFCVPSQERDTATPVATKDAFDLLKNGLDPDNRKVVNITAKALKNVVMNVSLWYNGDVRNFAISLL